MSRFFYLQQTGCVMSMLKAFQVQNEDNDVAIVFCEDLKSARQKGATVLYCDQEDVTCRRLIKFDIYSDKGIVPICERLKSGWEIESSFWGQRVDETYLDEHDQSVDDLIFSPDGMQFFVSMEECQAYAVEINERNDKFETFKQRMLKSYPMLSFKNFTGGYPYITFTAEFSFPGMKHGATIRWESDSDKDEQIYVAYGDTEAWNAFQENHKVAQ